MSSPAALLTIGGPDAITWRQTAIAAEVTAMRSPQRAANRKLIGALLIIAAGIAAPPLAVAYTPITPTMSDQTVTLTGHDLSIDQIVMVARYGAKVELSPEARDREANNYGLLIEASAEGVPVYWFNRGFGQQREIVLFEGDAMSDKNRPLLSKIQADRFRGGAATGIGPEIDAEEIVRAMMVVRANAMVYNAPSPQLAQMLLDLLNRRITPVVQSRGSLGEADLAQLSNVGQTMVGVGEAYLAGERMPAEQALKRVGLAPLHPYGADDNALTSSNAYATGQAALLVHDAEAALQWVDLIYAMDLNGMNSSITPLSRGVQRDRPEPWLNWHAARTLDMIRGSYLFDADSSRIIQDPESLRASSIRQGSAWEQWSALRQAVLFQANSSDHNPAVSVDLSPQDSWELSTPQMMRFYVKGGPWSHGHHGYIVSNANWDPYPMANQVESFVIALANMDIAVMLRIERFKNPFFTGVAASSVLSSADEDQYDYNPVDLQQEVQSLMSPLAPSGSAIVATVEDLQSQTRVKLQRARQAVSVTMDLLGFDLIEGSLWMDIRAKQDPKRQFGPAPTAVWQAFHKFNTGKSSSYAAASQFLRTAEPTSFYRGDPPQPAAH
jgi:histidine ammonia-lyase